MLRDGIRERAIGEAVSLSSMQTGFLDIFEAIEMIERFTAA